MKIRIALSSAENCEAYDVGEGQEIELDVEEYLKGVVAAEMGDGSLEALKTQAVASRTLAARYEGKTITDQSSKHQAFRASRMDWERASQAVQEHRRRGSSLFREVARYGRFLRVKRRRNNVERETVGRRTSVSDPAA